jgi:hypothetical protein
LLSISPRGNLGPEGVAFRVMVIFFVACSVADVVVTNFGLSVGCVELNGFVLSVGLGLWGIFRIGLLGYLVTVFLLGYRYCTKRSVHGALTMLKIGLLAVDVYIGLVVFSSICAVVTTTGL